MIEIKSISGINLLTLAAVSLDRADLRGADLRGADLRGADLRGADLREAGLLDANLSNADLRGASLRGANLCGASLFGADLRGASLRGADLCDASLRGANLRGADLFDADLRGADLFGADLRGADLCNAKVFDAAPCDSVIGTRKSAVLALERTRIVPEGGVVGWKKCESGVIVKLLVPAWAKRSNGTGRKCRAEYVKVIEVIGADVGISSYDNNVVYRRGGIVQADSFDDDRFNECSHGIHFFLTRIEAESY